MIELVWRSFRPGSHSLSKGDKSVFLHLIHTNAWGVKARTNIKINEIKGFFLALWNLQTDCSLTQGRLAECLLPFDIINCRIFLGSSLGKWRLNFYLKSSHLPNFCFSWVVKAIRQITLEIVKYDKVVTLF